MKIVFFGTPAFAVPFLQTLINDPATEVVGVVSQPDKPVGRKQILTAPPTKVLAAKAGIPVLQFSSLKNEDAQSELTQLEADVFIVVAYGKILPQNVLDIAPAGAINVHPSLLPIYRGPSPMQAAIREGDSQTGVSIMVLDAGMDTGPVLAQETITMDPEETYESLQAKVHTIGPQLMIETVKKYLNKELKPVDQDDTKATVTKLLSRDDARIDWNDSAQQIDRQIRAYTPWPGAWTSWNGKRLKIIQASVLPLPKGKQEGVSGSVKSIEEAVVVATNQKSLRLVTIQLEGKHIQSIDEFTKGHSDFVGSQLV